MSDNVDLFQDLWLNVPGCNPIETLATVIWQDNESHTASDKKRSFQSSYLQRQDWDRSSEKIMQQRFIKFHE